MIGRQCHGVRAVIASVGFSACGPTPDLSKARVSTKFKARETRFACALLNRSLAISLTDRGPGRG